MTRKYGVDTDEIDEEARRTAKDYINQQIAEDWTTTKLLQKYENLRQVTLANIPNLWFGLEFALSIKSILNIKGCSLPFAGILLGPASSLKTVIIECFKGYHNIFYTDNFSPKSLVSHISGKTEDQLRRDDLLPKLKNNYFMTPELAPIFSSREDDLLQLLGILTRVLDGQGYESDTGACGHRGYDEDIMFTWLGAAVDIPYKVHKLLGTLGPKLYFYRLPRVEESEDDFFNSRNDDFLIKKEQIRVAIVEYLTYFDMNPQAEILESDDEGDGLRKIVIDPLRDEDLAHRVIIRVAMMLARLRAIVPTWETKDTQGSDYAYTLAKIEHPSRAITQLRNLAKGHALSRGRNYITLDDIPIVINTALSTATLERVRIFELLIEYKGALTTNQICESLNTTAPTARRTMTELKATGLVSMEDGEGQTPSKITLKPEFDWFLSLEFEELKQRKGLGRDEDLLKEKCPPGEEGISLVTPVLLYDSIINKKITNALSHNTLLSGEKISFSKVPEQEHRQERQQPELDQQPEQRPAEQQPIIYNSGIRLGSQLILLTNRSDFFLSKIHPGILDNSLQVEFVTSKTTTNSLVRFLKRQTPKYHYYYSCYHCYDISKATFGSTDEYERHIVMNHKPATVGYPAFPDIEKLELERVRKKQGFNNKGQMRTNVADASAASQAGNGVLGNNEE